VGRWARPVFVGAVAAALWAEPALASGPAQQTFTLDAQKVSFQLPSGWRKDVPVESGWQWQAVAPGSVAHLYVNAIPTTKSFSVLALEYVQALQNPFAPGDTHYDFASSSAQVASLPAIKITFRYRNLTVKARPVEVATIYAFVHGGRFYVLDYVASPKWIAKMRPAFEQSVRTVRLLG
jgi:hypothetical protein